MYPNLFISCQWTSRLPPCPGHCKQCCNECWDMCLLKLWFSQDVCPVVGFLGHMVDLLPVFKGISYCSLYTYFLLNSWLPLKMKVLVAQSCPTLCGSMDQSPPDSSVHGILQARILEWVAIPFFRGSSWPWHGTQVSCIAGGFFTVWIPMNV